MAGLVTLSGRRTIVCLRLRVDDHGVSARMRGVRMWSGRLIRTPSWLLFVVGLGLFYFYSGGGPNQGSRFNLDRAILEEGRVTTESFFGNSEDRALYRGKHYCDKAPGTSFTALPALAATRVLLRLTLRRARTACRYKCASPRGAQLRYRPSSCVG